MRFVIIVATSVFALASAGSVFAETAQLSSTSPATTHQDVTQEHSEWFTEEGIPYKPCPASVVFPGKRHACLGLPRD
jgi:hypothetical protein